MNVIWHCCQKGKKELLLPFYSRHSKQFLRDLDVFNRQYSPILFIQFKHPVHDRFLIVDDVVYVVGASLKDAGRQLFAVIKTGLEANEILNSI